MTHLSPYLNFNGNCREAMTFYKESLGGELSLQTVGESPIAGQCPSAIHNQILHSSLMNGGLMLFGSDMAGQEPWVFGNAIGLMMNCSSEEEINNAFSRISAGGTVKDPLGVKFWGALFGTVIDKFGIRWMFHYDKNQQG
jgi:PhnB protein